MMTDREYKAKLKSIRKEIKDMRGYTKLVSGGSIETYQSYDWLVEREKVLDILDKYIKENDYGV